MSNIYDFKATTLLGYPFSFDTLRGNVVLIVNTASKCKFTPQYEGLQKLYDEYKDKGLQILAFPCNQFGSQEDGDSDKIYTFCKTQFSVSFPVFEKINVNGEEAHPLYNFLKKRAPGILGSEAIKWNFTKFLVSRDGKEIERFAPSTKPEQIEDKAAAWLLKD